MKWIFVAVGLLLSLNGVCQIELKSTIQAKELLKGKWVLYEYCVYEANFCKKDSSSSIIFSSVIDETKIGYTLFERGIIKKEGTAGVYDFIKVRTSERYTLDNFLFSSDCALIISFLDSNHLCLLQNSYQGFAKHYKRDTAYNAKPTMLIKSDISR